MANPALQDITCAVCRLGANARIRHVKIYMCGYQLLAAASRFSSLSGAFAYDCKKAFIPAGHQVDRDFFCLARRSKEIHHCRNPVRQGGP
jgi:hypothetical protein